MYNFEKVAIRCETWEQMQQIEQIAKSQNLSMISGISEYDFANNGIYFAGINNDYSNFSKAMPDEKIILYADFISSGVPSVEQMVASINA